MEEPILSEQPMVPANFNPPETSRAFSAMRHRNFQLYFGGQLISNIGTWMQIIAQSWLVYQIGHSEITLGWVAFAGALPMLVVSPFAGVVVDRFSRQKLLIMTQTGAMLLAFILAYLSFSNIVKEWHIIVLASFMGLVNAFDAPARQSFVPEMVGKEDLPNAIALNSIMFNSSRVIGPAIGGLLLVIFGAAWCFTINGISFIAVIIGLLLMKLPNLPRHTYSGSHFEQLVDGIRYTVHDHEMFALILIALVFSVFGMSYTTILPAFVEKNLGMGSMAYGWLNALTGLGAVAGAYLVARGFGSRNRGKWLIIANFSFAILMLIFGFMTSFPVTLILAVGLGLCFIIQFTTINTLLQLRVEDKYRGQVMALYSITFFGFAPFGNLAIGFLGQNINLRFAIMVFGLLLLLFSAIIISRTPKIRSI